MKGQVFYNDITTLFENQDEIESSIDFEKVLATAGGDEELKLSHNAHEISEFFVDPTLFSLLREYNDTPRLEESSVSGDSKYASHRSSLPTTPTAAPATRFGDTNDHSKIRTPQAKDVLPNRILEETLTNAEEPGSGDKEDNIHESAAAVLSYPEKQQQQPPGRLLLPRPPPSISNPQEDDQKDGGNSEDDISSNGGSSILNAKSHPDIPKTRLSKKFLAMATGLEQSCLRTIKREYLMDVPPRLRLPNNYAIVRQANTTSENQNTTKGATAAAAITDKKRRRASTTDSIQPSSSPPATGKRVRRRRQHSDPLVFSISIYQAHAPSKKLQDFNLLGNQTLTDMRDVIYCRMDFSAHGDRQDRQPEGQIINTLYEKLSPSCFYIDNTFYVDNRRQDDHGAAAIRQWLTQQRNNGSPSPSQQPPGQQDMDSVALQDLQLELNRPYLFDHQDHCQHVVIVRDIRLMEPRDEQDPAKYPVVTYSWRYTRYKCTMCMLYPAVYVTTHDYLSGFSPCYFCERCHAPFHLDEKGNPVSEFNIYTYHGS